MLSMQIKPINNAKDTAKYYLAKENYYFSGELTAQWLGLSAQKQNLIGEVTQENLEAVLNGVLPSGDVVGLKSKSGEIKHRGGYDLTFSAPKSVSYLALVCGHKEFSELHLNAVKTVLKLIEKEAAQARKSGKEGMEYEKTGNLCFAAILHENSREDDPQLHVHALMMNFTERLDGKWRALASDLSRNHGTMEWVMDNQIFLGLVYRSEVALGLKKMGLEIEHTGDPHGLFEIKHFDKELIRLVSKRRAHIEEQAKSMHSSSLKAYDSATLYTRKQKKKTSKDTLREQWKKESHSLGIDPSNYLLSLKEQTQAYNTVKALKSNNHEMTTGVKEAIAHLEEKKLSFSYQDILQASLHFSLGEQGFDALIKQIDTEITAHNLIALDEEDVRFTTPGLIAKERLLISQLANFPSQKKAVSRDVNTVKTLTDNESIQKVVMTALFHKEGVVRIKQQSAISRDLLKTLIDYAEPSKKIHVLSPTRMSALSINREVTHSPQTLWQWLMAIGKSEMCQTVAGYNHHHAQDHKLPFFKTKKEREILIVDDSQRLSPDDMNKLLVIAERRSAKVILLEKPHSLSGFQSDIPGLLDKACVKTLEVEDKPFRTTDILLVEAHVKEARILKTAEHFSSISLNLRQNTRVLTVSKSEAKEVNEAIRDQLKNQGEISRDEKIINTLIPISLTVSEKKLAKSYQPNWVLMRALDNEFKKFTIISINEQGNQLNVRDQNGLLSKLSTKNMSQSMQIYEQTPLAVGIGDKIVATGCLSFEGIKLGAQYDVIAFSRHGVKIKNGKKTIHLITGEDKHLPFSYAYAKTLYSADLKPTEHTLITLPAYALRQNTLSLLAESSKEKLTIITDDVTKANRYAMKVSTQTSAISMVFEAAQVSHGVQVIDEATTHDLLLSLDKALTLLSAEKPIKSDCEKALNFAIAHLSEREAAFKRTDLLKVAIEKAIGHFGINELHEVLDKVMTRGDLIAGAQEVLTTKEAISFEQAIINNVKSGINTLKPILSIEAAREQLAKSPLTKGQKDACELITTTSDQFVMIQGYAGTGKTTMSRTAIECVEHAKLMSDEGMEIIAVAPTHQAVKEMKALGIQAQTLKSFLIEQEQDSTLNKRSLVLLDESSMVSNRDCANLIQRIRDSGGRGVLLGDISQHQSIESGKPSKILMQEGSISVACMDNLVRQQVIAYKKAVETLIGGDTNKALEQLAALPLDAIERKNKESIYYKLSSSVMDTGICKVKEKQDVDLKQVPNDLVTPFENKTPIQMAVGDYLSRTQGCRDKTIVIIHENKKREMANNLIRDGLIEEASLGTENKEFPRLLSTNYTTAELYYCETYRNCLKETEVPILQKGNAYYQVMEVDVESKVVILKDMKGDKSIFMPEKESKDWKIELFKSMPGKLSVGEKIHFKKSDKALGRFANERVQVTAVTESSITVKDGTGMEHILNESEAKDSHWDYSYTATSYSIQGASSPFVIGVAETGNAKLNHLRSFYIMVTRGSLHAMIYTDDKDKLQKQLRVTPEKSSALESLNQIGKDIKIKTYKAQQTTTTIAPIQQVTKISLPKYDAQTISNNLSHNAEYVIESLLGEPNRALSTKNEYRYGRNGSLTFCLNGEKRGTWFNFETQEKGNMLHLIQNTLGLNFRETLEHAAKITGDDLTKTIALIPKERMKVPEKTKQKSSKTAAYAQQLALESQPIRGTLAERYLKEIRKIDNTSGENIRFHPRVYTHKSEEIKYRPALLNLLRDKDNKIVAVEAIYLDKDTALKANMGIKPKKTYGPKEGAGVLLSPGLSKESVTYITEGVETGLSIRDAVKDDRVISTTGKHNFLNINIELLTEKIVLCLDNDGKAIKEDKLIVDTIERLKQHGKSVAIAIPSRVKDFNDLQVSGGRQAVIDTLNKTINSDKIRDNLNKLDATKDQIKQFLEHASHQLKIEIPNKNEIKEQKKSSVEPIHSIKRVEMELC